MVEEEDFLFSATYQKYLVAFRMVDVSRTASFEITRMRLSVCLSVRPSARPSLRFLKIESLVFSDTVHDGS